MANLTESNLNSAQYDWKQYGFSLDELFQIAKKFFKDNEGKVFHPSYDLRNRILALAIQAKHGPFDSSKTSPLGALDFVGRDRRIAWASLGKLDCDNAKINFVQLLEASCPTFKPFIEAHQKEMEERLKQESEQLASQQVNLGESNNHFQSNSSSKKLFSLSDEQRRAVKEWLNLQTYNEFKKSATQLFPNDEDQQSNHIKKLQEQHFEQFINVFQPKNHVEMNGKSDDNQIDTSSFLKDQDNLIKYNSSDAPSYCSHTIPPQSNIDLDSLRESFDENPTKESANSQTHAYDNNSGSEDGDLSESQIDFDAIEAPQMWTTKDIKLFKDSIKAANGDGILKVGHGEIVTVRVPTYPDGSRIFWEFASDGYDIGFGLYFEWTKNPGNQVSIMISESDDDDEEEDEIVTSAGDGTQDCEKGSNKSNAGNQEISFSVLVPIHRRECHEEVYAGSHSYPGKGAYLLKFDNTYSLLRSKTLYYRIYYDKN